MRKKSHISLSSFLICNMEKEELQKHKKSFYIGSILPDCIPSFITRRHTFDATYFIVQKEIKQLISEHNIENGIDRKFCRRLGIITHYIADYFTFPHNNNFPGGFKAHCHYENTLKHELRAYVRDIESRRERTKEMQLKTIEDLFEFIESLHQTYMQRFSEIEMDIQYIVQACFEVVDAILWMVEEKASEHPLIPQAIG